MKHYLLYVPGLGDTNPKSQKLAVGLWRLYGVKAEAFPLQWATGRNFETKLAMLLARIDELLAEGYEVSLVGSSAGATAVMIAYAERPKIHSVVTICGVVNSKTPVNPKYYRENPAFKGAMSVLLKALEKLSPEERHRVMCVFPLGDPVVNPRWTRIRGALRKRVWLWGHATTIAIMLTLRAFTIVHFTKRKATQYEQSQ